MSPPLITHLYTADPSAHVFEGKLWIYPSHDRETKIQFNDNGDQYDMVDYHVFSVSSVATLESKTSPPVVHASSASSPSSSEGKKKDDSSTAVEVRDHGAVLRAGDVPWASKQLWAPDAAFSPKTQKYHLYFPARERSTDIFRIGVATGPSPAGPFVADPAPIPESFSIDPAAFVDRATGSAYLYFGGLWGGQLQCYQSGTRGYASFDASWSGPREPSGAGARALFPKVAPLADDMRSFAGAVRDLVILAPETGEPLDADDHARRFFEAAWCHRRRDIYYFSYSTGDTHLLAYATARSPLGPFTYAGRILEPVLGWTTHHSIVEFPEGADRWWLFHHDCELSGGVSHLRNVKVKELFYDEGGMIIPVKDD